MNVCFAIGLSILAQLPLPQQKMMIGQRALNGGPIVDVSKLPNVPPTEATMVTLNFKEQTRLQIGQALGQQTGMVEIMGANDPSGVEPRFTLQSEKPVPFWDALDQVTLMTHLQRTQTGGGPFTNNSAHIQLHGPTPQVLDYGPALYVGAFRLGPVTAHETFERVFLKSPRVVNTSIQGFSAEFPVLGEPNILAQLAGLPEKLEVVDDQGQSLLDPAEKKDDRPGFNQPGGAINTVRHIRIPLKRGAKPSSKIAKLRGSLPHVPSSKIVLEDSVGKTFRDGDVTITVNEYRIDDQNRTIMKFTLRRDKSQDTAQNKPNPAVRNDAWLVFQQGIRFVNASGQSVALSGGTGPAAHGSLVMNYTYQPFSQSGKGAPPTQIHTYWSKWVKWDLVFDFKDIPLP